MMASDVPPGGGFSDSGDFVQATVIRTFDTPMVQRTPVRHPLAAHEFYLLLAWTLLADWLIFRTLGFTGPAVFFALVPLLFLLRVKLSPQTVVRSHRTGVIIVTLLLMVALRLIWLGSGLNVCSGVVLVFSLAMWTAGATPLVLEGMAFAARVLMDGMFCVAGYRLSDETKVETQKPSQKLAQKPTGQRHIPSADPSHAATSTATHTTAPTATSSSWLLPMIAIVVFGSIFVFANPDLLASVSGWCSDLFSQAWSWIEKLSVWEIPFCLLALVIGAGLLRPLMPMFHFGPQQTSITTSRQSTAPMFAAYRNTLLTLIGLFAVYLVFEFATLWGRDFPAGFYYAGYAHQGAAWLTFALLLATGFLSLVFGGAVLQDARLKSIQRLAWIWSAENFLLAAAVYNRLAIYVGFNGMTRLRTVGFFGITLVIIGFVLVLVKIAKNRNFWWLIRSQLIAFVLTVIAFGIFPVDWIAHHYNVAQVTSGYLHPSVMVAVKPATDEGYLPLLGLTETDDPIIRRGVLAMLAEKQQKIQQMSVRDPAHWTKFQASTKRLEKYLEADQAKWLEFTQSLRARREAIEAFKEYAMQWY